MPSPTVPNRSACWCHCCAYPARCGWLAPAPPANVDAWTSIKGVATGQGGRFLNPDAPNAGTVQGSPCLSGCHLLAPRGNEAKFLGRLWDVLVAEGVVPSPKDADPCKNCDRGRGQSLPKNERSAPLFCRPPFVIGVDHPTPELQDVPAEEFGVDVDCSESHSGSSEGTADTTATALPDSVRTVLDPFDVLATAPSPPLLAELLGCGMPNIAQPPGASPFWWRQVDCVRSQSGGSLGEEPSTSPPSRSSPTWFPLPVVGVLFGGVGPLVPDCAGQQLPSGIPAADGTVAQPAAKNVRFTTADGPRQRVARNQQKRKDSGTLSRTRKPLSARAIPQVVGIQWHLLPSPPQTNK